MQKLLNHCPQNCAWVSQVGRSTGGIAVAINIISNAVLHGLQDFAKLGPELHKKRQMNPQTRRQRGVKLEMQSRVSLQSDAKLSVPSSGISFSSPHFYWPVFSLLSIGFAPPFFPSCCPNPSLFSPRRSIIPAVPPISLHPPRLMKSNLEESKEMVASRRRYASYR